MTTKMSKTNKLELKDFHQVNKYDYILHWRKIMKAYQVVENGKPLEEKEIETPVPTGKEIFTQNSILWSLSFRCTHSRWLF